MLVLIGPGYEGRDQEVEILSQETGLSGYDLRARLRPGAWGVVRVVADETQAEELGRRLRSRGLPACCIDSAVGQDPGRRIVYLRGLRCDGEGITLRLAERAMTVPYGALLVVVRGEVHVGRSSNLVTGSMSLGAIRPSAVNMSLISGNVVSQDAARESRSSAEQDVFAAADLHFATVPWAARMDARELDFPAEYVEIANLGERMDRCLDDLASLAKIRVDRGLRSSSLASHTAGTQRTASTLSGGAMSVRRGVGPTDEHFDAYSRMVAEAERRLLVVEG